MTILSRLNLFLQFWSAIWSVSLKARNPSTLSFLLCLFLQSPTSFIRNSPGIRHSSEGFMLGGFHVRTIRLYDGAACFSLIVFSLTVPDDSISLIFYWSFSLSLINANLLGSTSEVKSELARGFLELLNRS